MLWHRWPKVRNEAVFFSRLQMLPTLFNNWQGQLRVIKLALKHPPAISSPCERGKKLGRPAICLHSQQDCSAKVIARAFSESCASKSNISFSLPFTIQTKLCVRISYDQIHKCYCSLGKFSVKRREAFTIYSDVSFVSF